MVTAHDQNFAVVTADGFASLPAEVGHAGHLRVELPGHEAALGGRGFEYANGAGWAHDWIVSTGTGPGSASWPIRVVAGGWHRLSIEFGAPGTRTDRLLEIRLAEHSLQLRLPPHTPEKLPGRRVIDIGEASEMRWSVVRSNAVYLDPGVHEITLAGSGALGPGEMMIKQIVVEAMPEYRP